MCGIAGIVGPLCAEDARDRLQAMLAQIAYRGPDECTGSLGEGFAIGAVRLAIVDLVTGTQPAISDDGKVFVVFNGEIFNYLELRASLSAKGHRFTSNSEVEVLLHLYLEYGTGMARMLNGQFAVAIWDGNALSLHLLRDPFGIRPLFWWSDGRSVVFGSEAKALLANREVSVTLDPRALIETVRFWTVVGDRTMFNEIKQVPPGHALTWQRGETRLVRYWDWPFANSVEPLRLRTDADYFEAFDDAFSQAVKRQTMADVEVGAYVSGGIDSSVIVHHLDGLAGEQSLSTFSVSFDDPDYDESAAQEAVVNHYGTRHRVAEIGAADIAREFPTAVMHAEAALFRSAPVPMYRLSRKVRAAGIKVVMSGEGADEVLLGYDLFREAKIRRFWARQPDSRSRGQLLRRIYDYLPQYRYPRYFNLVLDFYRPTLMPDGDPHYAMAVRWNNGKALETCFSQDVQALSRTYEPIIDLDKWLPGGYRECDDDVERAQAIEVMTLLSNYLLSSQGDRMALANSVETRYPYLDLDFVRFASQLPQGMKLRGLKDKFILRETYGGILPEAVRTRKKFAYQAPEKKAFFPQGRLVDWAADLLSRDRIAADGIFDPAYVEQYCLTPPARDDGRQSFRGNMLFMVVLSTTLLADLFVRARPGAVRAEGAPRLRIIEHNGRTVTERAKPGSTDLTMATRGDGGDRRAFTIEEPAETYLQLLDTARQLAGQIVRTSPEGLTGAARYIRRASQELVDAYSARGRPSLKSGGAIFECLSRVAATWPDIAAGRMEGEQVFSGDPGLWKRAMTEWPMGGFARMTADFMIDRDLLGGRVLELGAGVGSCSTLIADHVSSGFIRSDLQPFLLKRQRIAGTVEKYDFNQLGPWRGLDTIFAVNALHCAKDKVATLHYLREMLRAGGVVVLGEGQPHTDERGTPWALNSFFGLFRGWWDVGGFVSREDWLAALAQAGFVRSGFAIRRAGDHCLGGVIWAVK